MSAQENSHIVDQEKSILEEQINTEEELVRCFYFNYFSEELTLKIFGTDQECENYYFGLGVNINRQSDKTFIKKIKFLRQIKMKRLYLKDIKSRNRYSVNSFFSSFPKLAVKFEIQSSNEATLNISPYLEGITRNGLRVLNLICIDNFKLSHPQIKRVMTSCKHVEEVKFRFCQLSVPVIIDFSKLLKNTNIKILDLLGSKGFSSNDLESNYNSFYTVFKTLAAGIATSADLKKTLTKISLDFCDLETLEARTILDHNGLENTEVSCLELYAGF
ncbi:unnamed protein product [Moneuplotes crassus]|uniref:Uncharacterized protein n=1 Tax=Euplotes crassus TaxID=5936 RepID=A0AAD1UGK3_EUPCR|nr:unnamed protein product [Moneuplotes crassus]